MWVLAAVALCASHAVAQPALNVNTATLDQLDALPGLGPSKALALLAWRGAHGPFNHLDELEAVPGLGPGTLAAIRGSLHCGEPAGRVVRVDRSRRLAPAVRPERIDPNVATVEELTIMAGIEMRQARSIVAYRNVHGPFAACRDLEEVVAIGPATVANLLPQCAVSESE